MKYINKKTQAVIETACVVSGGDWEVLEEQPKTDEKVIKKTSRKKSGDK